MFRRRDAVPDAGKAAEASAATAAERDDVSRWNWRRVEPGGNVWG